jgi:hypothetical protein
MMKLGRRGVLAAGATLAVSPALGHAAYPDRAIRFVGGFPPGGPADLSTPASAKKFYDDQMAFWDPIIKQSGAKPE